MDFIDKVLGDEIEEEPNGRAVRIAISLAKNTLNKYYSLTDSSAVYRIAMRPSPSPHARFTLLILPLQFFTLTSRPITSSKTIGLPNGLTRPRSSRRTLLTTTTCSQQLLHLLSNYPPMLPQRHTDHMLVPVDQIPHPRWVYRLCWHCCAYHRCRCRTPSRSSQPTSCQPLQFVTNLLIISRARPRSALHPHGFLMVTH